MSRLEIRLFGEFAVLLDDEPLPVWVPPKSLSLLALLALRERPSPRAALAAELWPDESESDARANLRRHLHRLTRALPDIDGVAWLHATASDVAWNRAAPAAIDAARFAALAKTPARYAEAVALYRGDLLARDLDDAILLERERLRALYVTMLLELAQRARLARNYAATATHAEAILATDEFREDALRLVMWARYAAGDRAAALGAYDRYARALRDDLHAEPAAETRALREAILRNAIVADPIEDGERQGDARPLVGRADETRRVADLWQRAARGSGNVLFLAGEAGIGKSRLAQHLLAHVEARQGRGALGRTSSPQAMTYQPIVEALRQLLPFVARDARDDGWMATLAPLIPELRRVHPDLPEVAPLDGERAQLRVQDAVVRALAACARVRPTALVLEDLHLAQADTIEMLGAIAERVASMPLLLVATYRSTDLEPDAPLRTLRRRLQRAQHAEHLALARLGEHDVGELVAAARPGETSRELVARVWELSEGNPLFAWQLIAQHAERPEGLDLDAAIRSVGDAIRTRLEYLPSTTRAIADVAATIGDTFSIEEIAAVGGWDEAHVVEAITLLLDRQLVAERAGASFDYGFTHALVGSAIYDATPAAARARRHRRAAEVLQRTRAEHGRGIALVAQHWERAGECARACEAYVQAARAALASYARAEARIFVQRALGYELDPRTRFEAYKILVAATDRAGDVETAERALAELESLAERLEPAQRYDAMVTRLRFHENHSQRAAQEATLDRLARFADEHDSDAWRVETTIRRTILLMQRGGTADGERLLRTIASDEAVGDRRMRELYYSLFAQSLFRQGKYDDGNAMLARFRAFLDVHPSLEGESQYAYADHKRSWFLEDAIEIKRTATRIVELALRRGDLLDEANGRIDLAYVTHQLHDTASAREEFERALELFARCRAWQGWVNTRINYGVVEFEVGHVERAMRYWREGHAKGVEIGVRSALAVVESNFADLAINRGDYADALVHARAAHERIVGSGERRMLSETTVLVGVALCGSGETAEGLRCLDDGLAISRELIQPRTLANHLALAIGAALEIGARGRLPAYRDELARLFEEDPLDHQHPGRICWALARACLALGDAEAAAGWAKRGRETVEDRLAALADPEDRAALGATHPNAALLAGAVPKAESAVG
ncbi:MAG: AAA family ATPase [bacterium]|nr:AAA family ATPase [bacterium]